jgi:site-specific recombinase XerD
MPTQRPSVANVETFFSSIDVAHKTEITYRAALRAFADFLTSHQTGLPDLGTSGIVPLRLLQEDSLAKFRHWLRNDRRYGRRTEGTYLAAAIRLIEWLDANSLLPSSITSSRMRLILRDARGRRRVGYKTQPIKEAVPQIIAHYDHQQLPTTKTPRGRRQRLSMLRNRAIVHTLFATGLRAQELASLRRSDCDDGHSDKILITGKGEKERIVLLNPEAQAALKAYLQARDDDRKQGAARSQTNRDPLFIRHDRDQVTPITTKTVWQIVNQAARALGLEATVSPHDFRRYIATAMLSEGMPLESVQTFLGHESIVTTRTVYAHTWTEVLEDQVKTYRPAPSQALRRAHKHRASSP